MATTTNYGWTTPDNTDLVKNGALAIRTLGNAIDTSMNTALGTKKAGMVLLNTTSFSGVTSISLPTSTFSATYDSYRIIFDLESITGVNPQLRMRFRTAGSDNTNSNYNSAGTLVYVTGGVSSFTDNATQSINLGQTNNASYTSMTIDLINPFATKFTNSLIAGTNADATQVFGFSANGVFSATTSFDSATWFVSTGNFAGTVSAYGYNK
jgi:hypothetical protein